MHAPTEPEYNAPVASDIDDARPGPGSAGQRPFAVNARRRATIGADGDSARYAPQPRSTPPPSGGRSAPVKAQRRAPAPGRLSTHGPMRRSREIPLVGRLALGVGVLAVAVLVLYVGAGGVGFLAGTLGNTVTSFVQGVTATPIPSPTPVTVADAPSIESPSEPYTNQGQVDLVVTVPQRLAGNPDYRVRVYLALKDQSPAPVDEKPLASTARMIIPVALTNGINDFSVTLVGPAGESEQSPLARWILDKNPPGIKLSSPKDGAEINRKAVSLDGRTQARSTILVRNQKTGKSISGTAAADGTFSLSVPITNGSNLIQHRDHRSGGERQHPRSHGAPRLGQAARLDQLVRLLDRPEGPADGRAADSAGRRSRRLAARQCPGDVHAEHPGHPHRSPVTRPPIRTDRRSSRPRSPRVPAEAVAARLSSSAPTSSGARPTRR